MNGVYKPICSGNFNGETELALGTMRGKCLNIFQLKYVKVPQSYNYLPVLNKNHIIFPDVNLEILQAEKRTGSRKAKAAYLTKHESLIFLSTVARGKLSILMDMHTSHTARAHIKEHIHERNLHSLW